MPVLIVNHTDAKPLEAQLIENLQRRDVHSQEREPIIFLFMP